MGRANRSSSSCAAALEEGGAIVAGGCGGRAKVASSKDGKPAVDGGPLLVANAFKEPRPAWRCWAANESGGRWACMRRGCCWGWPSCGAVAVDADVIEGVWEDFAASEDGFGMPFSAAKAPNDPTATSELSGLSGLNVSTLSGAFLASDEPPGLSASVVVPSLNPFSLSISLPPPGDLGLVGLFIVPLLCCCEGMARPDGFDRTPKLASIHSFSATAIWNPTPSTLSLASAPISFWSTCKRFFAQIVCKTPFFPAARAVAPSSGLKIAGRGFVRQFTFPLFNLTVVGTTTPAPRRKYSLLTAPEAGNSALGCALMLLFSFSVFPLRPVSGCACSLAGNTVLLPSQLISQSPSMSRVVSSSSHSTISTFVPSLLRPGSNSKRASALLELREGDSTSSVGLAEDKTALAEEVSTGLKAGLVEVGALIFDTVVLTDVTRRCLFVGRAGVEFGRSADSCLSAVRRPSKEREVIKLASLVDSVVVIL